MIVGHDLWIAFTAVVDIGRERFGLTPLPVRRAVRDIDCEAALLALFVVLVFLVYADEVE
ncbi:hypothetical protein D3C83_307550 [compost metagenome]